MTLAELHELLTVEYMRIFSTLARIQDLSAIVGVRVPTEHEMTAYAAYLHDLYGGIENMLRRILNFYGVPMPSSESWHQDLLELFSPTASPPLPPLFGVSLIERVDDYRGFRHVFRSRYSNELEWEKLKPLLTEAPAVMAEVCKSISVALKWKPNVVDEILPG